MGIIESYLHFHSQSKSWIEIAIIYMWGQNVHVEYNCFTVAHAYLQSKASLLRVKNNSILSKVYSLLNLHSGVKTKLHVSIILWKHHVNLSLQS